MMIMFLPVVDRKFHFLLYPNDFLIVATAPEIASLFSDVCHVACVEVFTILMNCGTKLQMSKSCLLQGYFAYEYVNVMENTTNDSDSNSLMEPKPNM